MPMQEKLMQLEIDGFGRVVLVVSGGMWDARCFDLRNHYGITLTREAVLF